MKENEILFVYKFISSVNRTNLRFSFYIVKDNGISTGCEYINQQSKIIRLEKCFVINELRNLAIETIETTNFLVVDGDGILSSNHNF